MAQRYGFPVSVWWLGVIMALHNSFVDKVLRTDRTFEENGIVNIVRERPFDQISHCGSSRLIIRRVFSRTLASRFEPVETKEALSLTLVIEHPRKRLYCSRNFLKSAFALLQFSFFFRAKDMRGSERSNKGKK